MSMNPGIVEESQYGVYIWRDERGRAVGDVDGRYMLIRSKKGDALKIAMLREAAKSHGITGGGPEFMSGSRPIDDDEWEHQMARAEAGEVPDEYDLGNLLDEYRYQKELDGNG